MYEAALKFGRRMPYNNKVITYMFSLFDYVDAHGANCFYEWWRGLQKKEQGKLRARMNMLRDYGEDLRPQILSDTDVPGILKIRVPGNVALRPLLCKGPHNNDSEFTMLMGATERDFVLVPSNAVETANGRKTVVANNINRRIKHVSIT